MYWLSIVDANDKAGVANVLPRLAKCLLNAFTKPATLILAISGTITLALALALTLVQALTPTSTRRGAVRLTPACYGMGLITLSIRYLGAVRVKVR